MTQVRLYTGINDFGYEVETNHFITITDPVELAVFMDNYALRYSNLIVNYYTLLVLILFYDGSPNDRIDAEVLNLPGARIAVANTVPHGRSSVLYYKLKHGDNGVYRRALYFSTFVEDVSDGVISDTLRDYLETYLNEFYTNGDYTLYDKDYNPLSFVSLNPKLQFKAPYRFPIRGNNSLWYNP